MNANEPASAPITVMMRRSHFGPGAPISAHCSSMTELLEGRASSRPGPVAERAQTAKAIEAFASLADRLDALAAERAERSRPWWRRLVG